MKLFVFLFSVLLLVLSVVVHVQLVQSQDTSIIENDICYICGTNVTLTNGTGIVDVSTILVNSSTSIKDVICNDLNTAAQSKVFTSIDCSALQTSTIITTTCGCPTSPPNTTTIVVVDEEEEEKEPDCLLCYNSTESNITLPNITLDILFLNVTFTNATCREVYDAALEGLLPANTCSSIEIYTNFTSVCGCFPIISTDTDNSTTTTVSLSPISAPTTVSLETNVCYICNGDSTATISNNDTLIDLSYIDSRFSSIQCKDIYESGLIGILPPAVCTEITITNTSIQSLCNCSNYINSNVETLSIIPSIVPSSSSSIVVDDILPVVPSIVRVPSINTCYICSDLDNSTTIQNPTSILDVSFLGSDSIVEATCFDMFTAAEANVFDSTTCTKFSTNTTIASICGCLSSVPLSNIPVPSIVPTIGETSIVDTPSIAPSTTTTTTTTITTTITNTCYLCTDIDNSTSIQNPFGILDVSFIGSGSIVEATCFDTFTAAEEDVFDIDTCIKFSTNSTVASICGCSNAPSDVPSISSISMSDVPSSTPSTFFSLCYICDSSSTTTTTTTTTNQLVLSNPNATISLSLLNNNPTITSSSSSASGTCQQLQDAGLAGGLTVETCDAIQNNTTIQSICGCPPTIIPIVPVPTPVIVPPPTTISKPVVTKPVVTKPIDASVKQPSKPKIKPKVNPILRPKPKLKPKVNPILRPIHPSPVVPVSTPTIIDSSEFPTISPTEGIVPSITIVTDEPTTTTSPIVTTTTDEPVLFITDEPEPTPTTIPDTDEPTPATILDTDEPTLTTITDTDEPTA